MRASYLVAVVVASLVVLGLGCRLQSADTVPTPGEEPTARGASGARQEPFDLNRLREFYDEDTSSAQRLDGLLTLLRQEIQRPSLPVLSMGSGPVDTWYVQGGIVRILGAEVALEDLARARREETDQVVRERLTVALGLAGDRSVIPDLTRVLSDDPQGFLRQNAALGLRDLRVPAVKEALHAALRDRYSVIRSDDQWGIHKEYPVRNAAGEALRVLGEKIGYDSYADLRRAKDSMEALSWLFEDKVPQVCLSAVQVAGQYGDEGLPYLAKFLEENRGDETLKAALEAAQKVIEPAEASDAAARAQ